MSHVKDQIKALASGEPGTTGREPFEDGTASDPNAQFSSTGTKEGTGIIGAPGLAGQHGTGHHHHQHGDHQSSGLTGGLGSGAGIGSAPEAGHHGHGHDGKYSGVGEHEGKLGGIANVGNTGNTGTSGVGSGLGSHGSHHHDSHHAPARREGGRGTEDYDNDRVGALDQGAAAYERTGAGGPATGGAAGTDRFDSDNVRDSKPGIGNTREGAPGDVTERAHDKGTGGVGGILGTTDKEFTGRDRLGGASGAYGDEAAHFKGNTSGPAGNTALTGREGTQENNPVAQAKSRAGEDVNDVHGAANPGVGSTAHPEHKKGLMEKVKDALH